MGRKQQSVLDDLVDITAKLPWQAGVGLAVFLYFVFHHFASRPLAPLDGADAAHVAQVMSERMVRQIENMFCTVLQYVIPLACLAGAAISAIRQRRQSELHEHIASNPSRDALESISWQEFEGLAAETFRRQGYTVMERGGAGPDGGVDLVLKMGNDKYLVQCKQWKTLKVGVATVRELYGVMAAQRAVGGFVVASGEFTEDARNFAEGRSIKLVPAQALLRMINKKADAADAVDTAGRAAQAGASPAGRATTPPASPATASAPPPACPKCGGTMVKRLAKQGVNAGTSFWGCGQYPSCKGARRISPAA